jgi:hypothetical protein
MGTGRADRSQTVFMLRPIPGERSSPMRNLGIPLGIVLALAAGVGIGAIPVVNENLHWNIWFVIPISGAILGAAFGWTQFQLARATSAAVRVAPAAILALAATIGYLGTDVGTYLTMQIAVADSPDPEVANIQEVPLRTVLSFPDYMRLKLASSSINMRPGSSNSTTVDLGQTAAIASFGVDLLGCFLGALLTLRAMALGTPYCDRCNRYKKRIAGMEIPLGEETAVEKLEELHDLVRQGEYASVVSYVNELAKAESEASNLKAVTDERVCPGCNEATFTTSVLQRQGNNWKELSDLSFRVESRGGTIG